jgi:hypothetical protein
VAVAVKMLLCALQSVLDRLDEWVADPHTLNPIFSR